jgi:hypothetical protein
MIIVKPSDLKFKYRRYVDQRDEPKFAGLPDPAPFNRDDLYEILPMLGSVMAALQTVDGRMLHLLEDILNEMPRFIVSREEAFGYLVGCASDILEG